MQQLKFITLPGNYSLCRLNPGDALPAWVFQSPFYTVSKSEIELSIVCASQYVPPSIETNGNWKLLRIDAVLDLSLTGITAKFSQPLAEAGINICVIATFDTDYVMIKEDKLDTAKKALQNAGFTVQ